MSTEVNKVKRRRYLSDISKNGWKQLKRLLVLSCSSAKGGRPAVELREVINAIFYVVKTGCSWRCLPHDFPCWQTV
jgi:putative transposase